MSGRGHPVQADGNCAVLSRALRRHRFASPGPPATAGGAFPVPCARRPGIDSKAGARNARCGSKTSRNTFSPAAVSRTSVERRSSGQATRSTRSAGFEPIHDAGQRPLGDQGAVAEFLERQSRRVAQRDDDVELRRGQPETADVGVRDALESLVAPGQLADHGHHDGSGHRGLELVLTRTILVDFSGWGKAVRDPARTSLHNTNYATSGWAGNRVESLRSCAR